MRRCAAAWLDARTLPMRLGVRSSAFPWDRTIRAIGCGSQFPRIISVVHVVGDRCTSKGGTEHAVPSCLPRTTAIWRTSRCGRAGVSPPSCGAVPSLGSSPESSLRGGWAEGARWRGLYGARCRPGVAVAPAPAPPARRAILATGGRCCREFALIWGQQFAHQQY